MSAITCTLLITPAACSRMSQDLQTLLDRFGAALEPDEDGTDWARAVVEERVAEERDANRAAREEAHAAARLLNAARLSELLDGRNSEALLLPTCPPPGMGQGATHAQTLLHTAADGGAADCVRILLEHDSFTPDEYNAAGYSPLHLASASGDKKATVALLLRYDADVNLPVRDGKGMGRTALHNAALAGATVVVRALLTAEPKCADARALSTKWRQSPLHSACFTHTGQGDRPEIVDLVSARRPPTAHPTPHPTTQSYYACALRPTQPVPSR